MTDSPRIVVISAGPTELGAGYRLAELGHDDWVSPFAGSSVDLAPDVPSPRRH